MIDDRVRQIHENCERFYQEAIKLHKNEELRKLFTSGAARVSQWELYKEGKKTLFYDGDGFYMKTEDYSGTGEYRVSNGVLKSPHNKGLLLHFPNITIDKIKGELEKKLDALQEEGR